jgi:uncharacterized protein DUF6894
MGTITRQTPYHGAMPRYSFNIVQGKFSKSSVIADYPDNESAQRSALVMFGDLWRDIAFRINEHPEWKMEIEDQSGKPIFRLRFTAESI